MAKIGTYLTWINARCKNSLSYVRKGIKCLITKEELEILWKRDNASLLKIPSVDRINNNKDYTFENCRFIEKIYNTRRDLENPIWETHELMYNNKIFVSIKSLASYLNLSPVTIRNRIKRGRQGMRFIKRRENAPRSQEMD